MNKTDNLIDALNDSRSSAKGITFISDGGNEKVLSYNELFVQASIFLKNLRDAGTCSGDTLILQVEDNETFIILFWACLMGKIIPVPLTLAHCDEYRLKLLKVREVLQDPFIAFDKKIYTDFQAYLYQEGHENSMPAIKKKRIFPGDFAQGEGAKTTEKPASGDTAYIQFSSGSTGDPKGIILTHHNLLENVYSFLTAKKSMPDDSYLSWLPLSHDMGLIGWHLNPLIAGVDQYLMSPQTFVNNPSLWFDKVSEKRVRITCSPNFGLSHFLKFGGVSPIKNWDLSHVRLIVTGAEHISHTLCNTFLNEMASFGLKKHAMMPGYGLAEATLAVAVTPCGEEFTTHCLDVNSLGVGDKAKAVLPSDKNCAMYVDEGILLPGFEIRICDDKNTALPDETIGHIQLKGDSVASGYFNNKAATESTYTKDNWLKTGDLGFLRDHRITITGRSKEMIIIGGVNFCPHDIERVAGKVSELKENSVVACGVYDHEISTEELILFVSYKKEPETFIPIINSVKTRIAKDFSLPVSRVIPIKSIPRTTSGKVQRVKLGQLYQQGFFNPVIQQLNHLLHHRLEKIDILNISPEERVTVMTDYICRRATAIIGSGSIDPDTSLVCQGFDSLMSIELRNIIECSFDISIPVSWFRKDESLWRFSEKVVKMILDRHEQESGSDAISFKNDTYLSPSILDHLKSVDTMSEDQINEMIRTIAH